MVTRGVAVLEYPSPRSSGWSHHYARLCVQHFNKLTDELRTTTDREDFERFLKAATGAGTSGYMVQHTLTMLARILIHTGKRMPELTSPDLLEYSKTVKRLDRKVTGTQTAHQLLSDLGIIENGPFTGRPRMGQVSIEDMVDSYGPACREVRDVFVTYLREQATSLDYGSIRMLELHLVELFWCDLEQHHPGIHSLNLTPEMASAWKKRVRTKPDGQPRLTLEHLFISVRAFYLDVAQWALERPTCGEPTRFRRRYPKPTRDLCAKRRISGAPGSTHASAL